MFRNTKKPYNELQGFCDILIYMNNNKPQLIIAGAIIIAVIIGGIFYTTKKVGGNTLAVTGSARQSVVADNAIWHTTISRNVSASDLKSGYAQLGSDLKVVQVFLTKNGITEASVTVAPIAMNQDYTQNANDPKRYTLMQNIEINTNDVQKITDIAKHVDDIVNAGVLFQSNGLEYYYSKLNESRVTLLTDAITDARARADAMAKSSKQSVGKLQSASSGVVQVLSKGAVEGGEYGQYDTSKIDKEISVTVRATFDIK
jgi:hypothetical protein